MKVVLQTVNYGKVTIANEVVGAIKKGYLILVGFTHDDNETIVDKMVDKILKLRIFSDENGYTNLSLNDVNGDILSVSQFTLYANTAKGRRPSFTDAMHPDEAKRLYEYFNIQLERLYKKPETGVFGADMKVESENDGPFTVVLDSKELFK